MPITQDTTFAGLLHDLVYTATRRLPQVFRDVATDRDKYPTLASLVETVEPSLWAEDPTRALLVVMRRAVAALPEETAKGCAEGRTWRHFGRLLYFGSEVDSSLQIYDDYVAAAVNYSGVPWAERTFGRNITRQVREKLAAILLNMEQQAIAEREQAQAAASEATDEEQDSTADPFDASAEGKTPYVSRFWLTAKFSELWLIEEEDGKAPSAHQRICLVGDAGTGKSRFIRETFGVETQSVWIDASTDETLVSGMWEILRLYISDISGLTESGVIKKAFGRLLALPDGPPLVIIDGITDPAMLDQYIPRTTEAYIVITSRHRPPKSWPWPVLEVGGLEDSEAQLMIAQLLPEADEDDRLPLAIVMDHRPLLIEHACSFISSSGVDVREFCAAVSQDVTNTLDGIADATDRKLTAIYRRYVAQLAEEAPESLRLLELLPFVAHQYVPPEYIMAYLLGVPYVKKEQLTRAQLAYEAAVRPLEACSLVEVHEALGVSMRPFVQQVLRRVFADRFTSLVVPIRQMAQVSREALYAEGWSLLTVVGRETCGRVFLTHLKDQFKDGGKLTQDGTIGGVQWPLLVANLWVRHFKLEFIHSVAQGRISLLQGGKGKIDWLRFLEDADDLPPMQRNERLGVVAAALRFIPPAEEAGTTAVSAEPMSDDEFRESVLNVMLELTKQFEDSQVGPLDLRLVNTWAFDAEQQDELRTLMGEAMRTARQDADEGTSTESA